MTVRPAQLEKTDGGPVVLRNTAGRESVLDLGMSGHRIPALDGIRAISVWFVILFHSGFAKAPAGLGVLAFFVLSGFLITWLLLKEHGDTGTISLTGFYKRRSKRIFPAFYVYWLVCAFLLIMSGHKLDWPHSVSSLLYVSNYYQGLFRPADSFVSHSWSLSVEEQFYLLWPLMFCLGRKNISRLAKLVALAILVVWGYRIFLAVGGHADQGYIYRAFETRIDHLLVGCLTAILVKEGVIQRYGSWLYARWYCLLPPAALLALSTVFTEWSHFYRSVAGFIIEPLLVAVVMIQLIVLSGHKAWSWIESRPFRYCGLISYSLYLWHPFVIHSVMRRLEDVWAPLRVLAAFAATILAASASYFLIERLFLKRRPKTVHQLTPEGAHAG
jgi:peptidoglycan/LPS O-acetylase OafA/YrhL